MLNLIAQAYQSYASLMRFASSTDDPNLGGQLLYVGELDDRSRAFAIAANIAGAATLAASAHPAVLRHAQREGVIDFLVNSLDEALRILKNEIRKREAVAVAVSLAPTAIEAEMMDRGVLPNLLPPGAGAATQSSALYQFLSQGAQQIPAPGQAAQRLLIWAAPEEYAQNLAAFESMLAGHLAPTDPLNRRWLRLSPRYLGPAGRRLRSVACDEQTTARLIANLGPPLSP
jgi:urocanate hydratase